MLIATTYAVQLFAEKNTCCGISHHVVWYKINIAKKNYAYIFPTLKLKVKVKVTP
jgi:hypothetical protein